MDTSELSGTNSKVAIVWFDDQAMDPDHRDLFVRDWRLDENRFELLSTDDLEKGLALLRKCPGAKLVLVDLLWGDERDAAGSSIFGVKVLERVRQEFPDLKLATWSKMRNPELLTSLFEATGRLNVTMHFLALDATHMGKLNRMNLLESLLREAESVSPLSLRRFSGEVWGAVMFADVSGFSRMTEALWRQSRQKLARALNDFYASGCAAVAKHGGILDKLIGDEIMAVFPGAKGTAPDDDAGKRCVDASLEVLDRFRSLEREFIRNLDAEPEAVSAARWQVKVGMEGGWLWIGDVVLPNGERELCTIGHAVNIAARVKGLGGDYTLTMGPTVRRCLKQTPAYATREMLLTEQMKGIVSVDRVYIHTGTGGD
ncbi:MAG: adenylate/guanylate cyclase domain-containing protein [Actinomycetota bacterium]